MAAQHDAGVLWSSTSQRQSDVGAVVRRQPAVTRRSLRAGPDGLVQVTASRTRPPALRGRR